MYINLSTIVFARGYINKRFVEFQYLSSKKMHQNKKYQLNKINNYQPSLPKI